MSIGVIDPGIRMEPFRQVGGLKLGPIGLSEDKLRNVWKKLS